MGNPFIIIQNKRKKVKLALTAWSKEIFGDIFKQIASLEDVIKVHEIEFELNPTVQNREKLHKVEANITLFYHLEKEFWRILDNNGNWLDSQQDMEREAMEFFQTQFSEERLPTNFDDIQHVPKMVSNEQNVLLWLEPTLEEVKATNFGLNGDNASGWFVKGRSIVKNILLTQEIISDIRLRGKPSNVVIKLDMVKAYDRVSWANDFFKSTRGVKQDGPLSRTLFILEAGVLGRALDDLFDNLDIIGFAMPKWGHNINYLSYADDIIIFCSSHYGAVQLVMNVLEEYEAAFGQKINKEKSSFYMHEKALQMK
ncbi:uncharacterized protein [Nicotiana sylvestris]|uniref:uncharacterized protein n=1 Tax=Nicotiana sylvestris TaxID=4096 RepID=UPI00388CC161